jgi:hypothetical protein
LCFDGERSGFDGVRSGFDGARGRRRSTRVSRRPSSGECSSHESPGERSSGKCSCHECSSHESPTERSSGECSSHESPTERSSGRCGSRELELERSSGSIHEDQRLGEGDPLRRVGRWGPTDGLSAASRSRRTAPYRVPRRARGFHERGAHPFVHPAGSSIKKASALILRFSRPARRAAWPCRSARRSSSAPRRGAPRPTRP